MSVVLFNKQTVLFRGQTMSESINMWCNEKLICIYFDNKLIIIEEFQVKCHKYPGSNSSVLWNDVSVSYVRETAHLLASNRKIVRRLMNN